MKSNNITVIASALTVAFALSACSHKSSTPASTPVDSATAAESDLNNSGCSFKDGAAFPTSGGESQTELNCKTVKGVNQAKAVSNYISKISAAMKEPGRKNIGQLQVKLNAASAKLSDLQAQPVSKG